MPIKSIHKFLTYFIALIWMVNGLFCKVLNLVPRHQQIVKAILGTDHSRCLTIIIGFSEVFMSIWIFSKFKPRLNAIVQIFIISIMNALEFLIVPDLLLWGKANSIFALLLILLIYFNEFSLNPHPLQNK